MITTITEGCRSKAKFAVALGVSEVTLRKYLRHRGCPIPPIPVWTEEHRQLMQEFLSRRPRDRAASFRDSGGIPGRSAIEVSGRDRDEYNAVRTRKETARTELLEIQRKILQGQFIERSAVDDALCGLCQTFVHSLDCLQRGLPTAMEGLSTEQANAVVCDHLDAVREELLADVNIRVSQLEQLANNTSGVVRRQRGRPAGR